MKQVTSVGLTYESSAELIFNDAIVSYWSRQMYIVLDICIYFVFIKPEPKLYATSYCIYDGHLYIICTGLYHIFSMLCVFTIFVLMMQVT